MFSCTVLFPLVAIRKLPSLCSTDVQIPFFEESFSFLVSAIAPQSSPCRKLILTRNFLCLRLPLYGREIITMRDFLLIYIRIFIRCSCNDSGRVFKALRLQIVQKNGSMHI